MVRMWDMEAYSVVEFSQPIFTSCLQVLRLKAMKPRNP